MLGKIQFALGAAAGFILGARSGRQSYEKMKTKAGELWNNPRVQERLTEVGDAAKSKLPPSISKLTSRKSGGTASRSGTARSGSAGSAGRAAPAGSAGAKDSAGTPDSSDEFGRSFTEQAHSSADETLSDPWSTPGESSNETRPSGGYGSNL